ncbi:MAG TPA: thiamine phosphate synthase [Pyrinomonadaceae bacterium]|jgi:thiamine-phosphate pyrophosphorylase
MLLPKIYPITDARLSGLSHAAQIVKLIEGGARFIQLREKSRAPKDFFADALAAIEIARPKNVKIIINDRVDIALAIKADGVHLGQTDLPPREARRILGEKAIIGFSTHDVEQVLEALNFPIDYLAVGPVFATTTKENPDAIIGVEMVKKVREIVGDFPLVAIGGITSKNFREVFAAGADSVAIIGDLLSEADKISEKTKNLIELSENSEKLC